MSLYLKRKLLDDIIYQIKKNNTLVLLYNKYKRKTKDKEKSEKSFYERKVNKVDNPHRRSRTTVV